MLVDPLYIYILGVFACSFVVCRGSLQVMTGSLPRKWPLSRHKWQMAKMSHFTNGSVSCTVCHRQQPTTFVGGRDPAPPTVNTWKCKPLLSIGDTGLASVPIILNHPKTC